MGYQFDGWYLDGKLYSTQASISYEMEMNTAFTAKFNNVGICTIGLEAGVGGSVSGDIMTVTRGTTVTVTASVESGYRFAGWVEGLTAVSTDEEYCFTAQDDRSLKAVFEQEIPMVNGSSSSDKGDDGSTALTVNDKAEMDIQNARSGEIVEMNLSPSNTIVEKKVFEALKGKNITLKITSGNVVWTVNGKDISASENLKNLDLGVKTNVNVIPDSVLNALIGERTTMHLSLNHNGPFGFRMTMEVTTVRKPLQVSAREWTDGLPQCRKDRHKR